MSTPRVWSVNTETVVSWLLGVVGSVLTVIAFTQARWFHSTAASFSIRLKFGDVSTLFPNDGRLAGSYFGWLGWLLFAVALACLLLASAPIPQRPMFWWTGAAAAMLGVVATIGSLATLSKRSGWNFWLAIRHADAGWWLALFGFVAFALACACAQDGAGSRRDR